MGGASSRGGDASRPSQLRSRSLPRRQRRRRPAIRGCPTDLPLKTWASRGTHSPFVVLVVHRRCGGCVPLRRYSGPQVANPALVGALSRRDEVPCSIRPDRAQSVYAGRDGFAGRAMWGPMLHIPTRATLPQLRSGSRRVGATLARSVGEAVQWIADRLRRVRVFAKRTLPGWGQLARQALNYSSGVAP